MQDRSPAFSFYYSRSELEAFRNAIGVSAEEDCHERNRHCGAIRAAAKRIGFPYYTSATAQHLFHRFFAKNSFRDFDPEEVAITCLFFAAKSEETVKKARDIIAVGRSVQNPDNRIDNESPETEDWKRKIMDLERALLEATGFNFRYVHPSRFLVKFIKRMNGHKLLGRRAWAVLEDSYRTTISVQFTPQTIALACIVVASKLISHEGRPDLGSIPSELPFKSFRCEAEDVKDVAQQLCQFYEVTSESAALADTFRSLSFDSVSEATRTGTKRSAAQNIDGLEIKRARRSDNI
ncbi:cyclin-like protein [Cladochytrium replicatum]|nr:cyclin-like protein [Cladochytrium replicatum]